MTLQQHEANSIGRLCDVLNDYGAPGLIAKLTEYESSYWYLLQCIQNGGYLAERDPNEDPAKALEQLREITAPSANEAAGRALLVSTIARLVEAADEVATIHQRHAKR